MSDEHEEDGWSPDKERKETSPKEIAKVYAEAVAKAFKEQAPSLPLGHAAGQYVLGTAAPPTNLSVAIRKIRNGYIIVSGVSPYPHAPHDLPNEEYAHGPLDALDAIRGLVADFLGVEIWKETPLSGPQGVGPGPEKPPGGDSVPPCPHAPQ